MSKSFRFLIDILGSAEGQLLDREIDVDAKYAESKKFQEWNKQFKKRKIYIPAKSASFLIILIGYCLSLFMLLLPFMGWYLKDFNIGFAGFFTLIFSSHAFKYTWGFHKSARHYFLSKIPEIK